jgi:hypothetical protein
VRHLSLSVTSKGRLTGLGKDHLDSQECGRRSAILHDDEALEPT